MVVSSPQGRFAGEAAALDGARFEGTDAYGKYLFHHYEGGRTVAVHLGRQGLFLALPVPPPAPRRQVRMRVEGPALAVDLIAPMRCARVDEAERAALVAGLGPDPIRDDADPERAWAAVARARQPIGTVLLDQAAFAGVGNVFRAEALFLIGVAPRRPAADLSREEFDRLWSVLVTTMRRSVDAGHIVTADDGDDRWVYKREQCRRCGAPVEVTTVGGRTSYHCPVDQPG